MKTESKHKKGTVGYNVEQLVKRFGKSTLGIYTLRAALETATGCDVHNFTPKGSLGQVLLTETPGYIAALKAEKELFCRCGMFYIDSANHVAKNYIGGRVYAIRFAVDMDEARIKAWLASNPPVAYDWRPYNENTNTFLD